MTLFIFVFVSAFLWIYMGIEGDREGYYYHEANKTSEKKKNLHGLFLIQRTTLATIIIFLGFSPLMLLGLAFTFPFIHDGFYYIRREKLRPGTYPKGFTSNSTTSTAKIEIPYEWRLVLFIIGIALWLTAIYLTLN